MIRMLRNDVLARITAPCSVVWERYREPLLFSWLVFCGAAAGVVLAHY